MGEDEHDEELFGDEVIPRESFEECFAVGGEVLPDLEEVRFREVKG
jgi:hypothetical protein